VGEIVAFSFAAALSPTLLAATTVMLLPPQRERLMLGYWLGAMVTSITFGLIVVYALQGAGLASTTRHTLTPVEDFVVAAAAVTVAALLASRADQRVRARMSRRRRQPKNPAKWQQRMRSGTAATAFALGAALSLPGATYLVVLDRLSKLHYTAVVTVLVLIGSNVIQLIVLEVPMLASAIWPAQAPLAIDSTKAWMGRHGRHGREYAAAALVMIGAALAARGVTRDW
jgi:hypothetical protein